jgi:hypothetical protein
LLDGRHRPAHPGVAQSVCPTGDVRTVIPRFTAEARAANQALVDLLGRIATDTNRRAAEKSTLGPPRTSSS